MRKSLTNRFQQKPISPLTGHPWLRILKDNPLTASIPVIAITGEVASDRSKLLLQLGALDILNKPYKVQELLSLLENMLR